MHNLFTNELNTKFHEFAQLDLNYELEQVLKRMTQADTHKSSTNSLGGGRGSFRLVPIRWLQVAYARVHIVAMCVTLQLIVQRVIL